MSIGTRSWGPINFVVFGSDPLVPARIEQKIATVLPSMESIIESFEDYAETLDFCKNSSNVAVILLLENCGPQAPEDVYRELAKPYEASGWPTIGIIIRKSSKLDSIKALKAMRSESRITGYYGEDEFDESTSIQQIFETIWNQYVQLCEQTLLPSAISEVFNSLIDRSVGNQQRILFDRTSEILTMPLNLSWLEKFRVKSYNSIQTINSISPELLVGHSALSKLVLQTDPTIDPKLNLLEITQSKESIAARTIAVSTKIVRAAEDKLLEQLLFEAKTEARPGRPGLLRHLATQAENIRNIYQEIYGESSERKAI